MGDKSDYLLVYRKQAMGKNEAIETEERPVENSLGSVVYIRSKMIGHQSVFSVCANCENRLPVQHQ